MGKCLSPKKECERSDLEDCIGCPFFETDKRKEMKLGAHGVMSKNLFPFPDACYCLTASEAFAKGDVGDWIQHANGEEFQITEHGTLILSHMDVNDPAFLLIKSRAPAPSPLYARDVFNLPAGATHVLLHYRGGATVELPADITTITYDVPVSPDFYRREPSE